MSVLGCAMVVSGRGGGACLLQSERVRGDNVVVTKTIEALINNSLRSVLICKENCQETRRILADGLDSNLSYYESNNLCISNIYIEQTKYFKNHNPSQSKCNNRNSTAGIQSIVIARKNIMILI